MASDTTDNEPHAGEADSAQTARTTGRGFLVIMAAKVWFLVTAALTQLGLPIFFGDAQLFGVFKIVTEAIGLINMVMITGTLQAVAKMVSEQPARARALVGQALRLQCVIGLPIAILYALASPWIASDFFNDPGLTGLMQLSSGIILFYAFYAIFVGYLNGIKSFVRQAALDIGFQTIKTVAILGLVFAGLGVAGAVGGFVAAAGVICVVSALLTWWMLRDRSGDISQASEHVEDSGDRGRMVRFLLLVMAYTFALNGLLRIDLFAIKSIASQPPEAWAAWSDVFAATSDKFAGFYGAALNISRLPYQGVIAITFVIFPLISEATFAQDASRTRQYIEDTFRYCLLLIAIIALPLILSSESVIGAMYSADYQAAGEALAIMSTSIIFFALFFVAATVITGAGRPGIAALLMGGSLGVAALGNWLLVSGAHESVMQLMGAAPARLGVEDSRGRALARARRDRLLGAGRRGGRGLRAPRAGLHEGGGHGHGVRDGRGVCGRVGVAVARLRGAPAAGDDRAARGRGVGDGRARCLRAPRSALVARSSRDRGARHLKDRDTGRCGGQHGRTGARVCAVSVAVSRVQRV